MSTGQCITEVTSITHQHDENSHNNATRPAPYSSSKGPNDSKEGLAYHVDTSTAADSIATIDTGNRSADFTSEDGFPEGGLRAWLVVFGSFCAMFMVFGIVNSTSAFQDYLSRHQLESYSAEQISWIFSLELFFVFFCGIYAGHVFDARGPRLLVAVGSVGSVLSMILLGLCKEYYQFILCYAFLSGISGALLNAPAYAAIGHFFSRRRGLATGLAVTAGSIGGVTMPLMLRALLPKVGFAWSTRILGFLLLASAVPANLFIRRRLPPSADSGSLLPDLSVFKDARFTLCVAGMFLLEWGLFVPVAYITSFASPHTKSTNVEAYGFDVLAVLNAASFFGRTFPGFLSDKLGRFNIMMGTLTLCAISVLALWLPARNSEALLIVFAVVFGFASGSNLSLIAVCLGQLCATEHYGRYFGTAYSVASFGTLTSIPIAGALLDTTHGSYWGLIIFSGASYVATLMCYTTARSLAVGFSLARRF